MPDGDTIAQVAVVILLLTLSVPALATAYDYAGTPYEYEETLTVDYTTPSQVSEGATATEGYGSNETITVGGTQLVEGDDYRWNKSSGEVTWLNTSATSDGDSATITYRAFQRTPQTSAAWSILMPFTALFGLFGFVSAVRALWAYTAEVWDL